MSQKSQRNSADRLTIRVEEAARLLGISRGNAYALARNGGLPTIRLGKRLLVPKAALDRMLKTAVDKMTAAGSSGFGR